MEWNLHQASVHQGPVQECMNCKSKEQTKMAKEGKQQGRKGNKRTRMMEKKMKGLEPSARKPLRKRGRKIGQKSMQNLINSYYVGTLL